MVTVYATTLVIVLLTGIVIRLLVTLRANTRMLERAYAELLRAQWLDWWTRNAAEMTSLDASKPYFQRLAYAAQLAPSLSAFLSDCDALADRDDAPQGLRTAARGFAAELRAPRVPWEVWVEETGKPPHAATAIGLAYREAISSGVASGA